MTEPKESTPHQIDWFIFSVGCGLLIAIVVPIILAPEASFTVIDSVFTFLTQRLGVLYILSAIIVLTFLLWIALSRHGNIVLGDIAEPEHGTFSWAAMLFCAGIGASLIYWGSAEWVFYYVAPPFGIEPKSAESVLWASSYGMFHWGPIGWAFYCLPAVALGCSYHVQKIPSLRLSAACNPVLGKQMDGWPGRVVDLLFIIGLLGTAATGLGLGTSVVSSAVTRLTNIEDGVGLQFAIISLATFMIGFSVFRGLDKGIKILSNINAVLALILILFVLVVGPTTFILEMSVASIGNALQNFIQMLSWTDPLQKSNFVESWTVFYWAWWLALGPFVGMFVCKISEGRTLRQVIFGMLGWGSLGCSLFFMVLGNYTLWLELNGVYPVVEEVMNISPSHAIAGVISNLPGGQFWLVFLIVIGLVFMATTYDSASYTLAAGATRSMKEHEHPDRWHRVFWACALGVLPISLLFLGGLRTLQTASIVASVPLLFVYVLLGLSVYRTLTHRPRYS
ncbi:MAG: BCCT family transporter [Pseudomonadales bacterium]